MFNQTSALKEYLKNRENVINSDKSQTSKNRELFNEKNFYRSFVSDMMEAKKEIIIYSPFVTKFRADFFKTIIAKLRKRNIEIFIFTRPIDKCDSLMQPQIQCALERYEEQGVNVFYLEGSIHEKVAVIDREILWEGSLNILSQRSSREIMRRIADENSAMQVMSYLGLNRKLAEGYKLRYERLCRNLIDSARLNSMLKIRSFLLGFATPIVIWSLFMGYKAIALVLGLLFTR